MKKLIFLAALGAALSAQAAAPTPQAAVEQFLKFELEGGRLQSWPFQHYLAVAPGYDEPGWDQVHVVESWKAGPARCEAGRCKVTVSFSYTATEKLGAEQVIPHPGGGTEQVEYVAVERGGQWLLESSNGAPRIARATMDKMLKDGL